jgi:tetratricopeptide (TPR) repeat protein
MKTFKLMVLVLAALTLASCMMMVRQGTVRFDASKKNDVLVTSELRALMEANPRPKVVVRVSNPPANVTEAEKFNSYVNGFERVLIENGFTVRDRALLENLMRSGNIDYETIREKIDTDLIIDILSLDFDIANPLKTYYDQKSGQNEYFRFENNYVDCRMAGLSCRLTIVSKGQLGGMFSLYQSWCDGKDLEILVNGQWLAWGNAKVPKYYASLAYPIRNEEIPYVLNNLTMALINILLKDFNDRIREASSHYDAGDYGDAQLILSALAAKDPDNSVLHRFQALLDAHAGDFAKADRELETASRLASAWHHKAMVSLNYARVYALKGEKALALSFLRQGFSNGLDKIAIDLRTDKDLAAIAASPEFDALLTKFGK